MTVTVIAPTGASGNSAFTTTENVVATSEAVQSTSYIDATTVGPSVTITVPASGKVLVTFGCSMTLAGTSNNLGPSMSFALSGANTLAASSVNSIFHNNDAGGNNCGFQISGTKLLTGLTPGSTTFTAKYATLNSNSQSAAFANRRLRVEPVDGDTSGGSPAFATTEATVATGESTTSNTFTDLATVGPAVTITVPASGKVKLTVGCQQNMNPTTDSVAMGWAASGANTISATTASSCDYGVSRNPSNARMYSTFLLSGLSAGSTTFTAKYRSNTAFGVTATFTNRVIRVEPVDADRG